MVVQEHWGKLVVATIDTKVCEAATHSDDHLSHVTVGVVFRALTGLIEGLLLS